MENIEVKVKTATVGVLKEVFNLRYALRPMAARVGDAVNSGQKHDAEEIVDLSQLMEVAQDSKEHVGHK